MSGEKNHIRVVSSADEAQLIVEVNGRRSSSSGATGGLMALRDDQFYISFLVKVGPKLQAERFANVPRTYRLRGFGATVYRLGVPRARRALVALRGLRDHEMGQRGERGVEARRGLRREELRRDDAPAASQ